jgi:hypothetical protein
LSFIDQFSQKVASEKHTHLGFIKCFTSKWVTGQKKSSSWSSCCHGCSKFITSLQFANNRIAEATLFLVLQKTNMILFILDILSWLWKSDFGTFYKKKIPLKGLGDQFLDFYDYIQLRILLCFYTYSTRFQIFMRKFKFLKVHFLNWVNITTVFT